MLGVLATAVVCWVGGATLMVEQQWNIVQVCELAELMTGLEKEIGLVLVGQC